MVKIITTARALIVNDQKQLLLVKNKQDDIWFTPGGWVDGFETLEEACTREVYEEVGITVKPIKLFKIDYYKLTKEQNIKWGEAINKIEHYFLCNIEKGEIKSDSDNKNLWNDKDVGNTEFIKFFSKEDLVKISFAPNWLKDIFTDL